MDKSALIPLGVILFCVLLTQGIAYLIGDRKTFTLNYIAIYTIAFQWVCFLHAGGILFGNERTEKYYDLMGSLTFISTTIITFWLSKNRSVRMIILVVLVLFWTIRLGSFLFIRISNHKGVDSRFTEIKQNNFRFLMTWTLQGVWTFITLVPLLTLSQIDKDEQINPIDVSGGLVWLIGFLFEVFADYQKYIFRSFPENRNEFIQTGLWKYSRHPNYFGEILLWLGFAIIAFSGTRTYKVFISPVFVALLLIFVSGIPLLEKAADEKFGDREDYQNYKKSTPVLVPFVGRSGNAMF